VDLAQVELERLRHEKSAMERLVVSATKEQIREIMEAIAPYVEIIEED
jgi:alkylhydroperoxidase/carboxymuconolactone decarboxylase family protein YurZ